MLRTVTLDGQVLPGFANYTGWWLTDLIGWDASPEPKHQVIIRSTGFDGGFEPISLNVLSRVLEIRGTHRSEDPSEVRSVRAWLPTLAKRRLVISVDDGDGPQSSFGVTRGAILIDPYDDITTTFSVVIECPDPLKYGPEVSQSGSSGATTGGGLLIPPGDAPPPFVFTDAPGNNRLSVANDGTEPSWPVIEVPGTFDWFRLSSGLSVVEFRRHVTGSQVVVVDSRTETVRIGNSDVTGSLVRDQFFAIPPGGASVFFEASHPVMFTVKSRSARL